MRHETHAARMERLLRTLPPALRGMGFGDPDDAEYAHASDVVAWAINEIDRIRELLQDSLIEIVCLRAEIDRLREEREQPPRGWLTPEERAWLENEASRISSHLDAVASMRTVGSTINHQWMRKDVALLRALLARSTPPKVKVPEWMHDDVRREVVAAIREAGGEVQ